MILSDNSDITAMGYYRPTETANLYGGSPELSFSQAYIVQNILHSSLGDYYSSTFEDVANIKFNIGNATNSHITFGQVSEISTTNAYMRDLSNGSAMDELEHGDIWLNGDWGGNWAQTSKGSLAYWSIMHEIAHSLGL
jgi:hypothetical protein